MTSENIYSRNEGCFSNQEVYCLNCLRHRNPMSVMKNNQHVYVSFCLLSVIFFWLPLFMGEISIASLNIIGAREGKKKKKIHLFEIVNQKKKLYICFICSRDSQ